MNEEIWGQDEKTMQNSWATKGEPVIIAPSLVCDEEQPEAAIVYSSPVPWLGENTFRIVCTPDRLYEEFIKEIPLASGYPKHCIQLHRKSVKIHILDWRPNENKLFYLFLLNISKYLSIPVIV